MAESRPLYLGPRLRRLRRELGLTQQAMANDLEVSPSYIALIERNQRPVTADMLLRLARTYRLEVTDLASDDLDDYRRRIQAILRDPIFTDIDLPPLEVADLATSFPGISEALLRLHGAYAREQLALAARQNTLGFEGGDPVVAAQQFLGAAGNYFHALDSRAEDLSTEVDKAGGAVQWLEGRGVRVRFLPSSVLGGMLRRFDRHNQQLLIDETLPATGRAFQLATHIAYSAMRPDIARIVREGGLDDVTTQVLVRRVLAGYGAAALLMPYGRFAKAVDGCRYDIEALSGQFGVSFEQVAHRLTTLSRPGDERIGFFFLRVDEAGNVSKRLDGAGFPFAEHGGRCPLWNVHSAFRKPGEILTQWLELPDGSRFFSIARSVVAGGGGHGKDRVMRAIALACTASEAPGMVYADTADPAQVVATPIGIACRLCQRAECLARSAPPIGRDVQSEDYVRAAYPFSLAES